jgi:hypothetical protein
LLLLLAALAAGPADGFRVQLFAGASTSFGSTLTVRQDASPPLTIDADWAGRPLEGPIYYAVRLSRWSGGRGISLSLIHHKLYLENPTAEVPSFSVSHGYNLLTLERGWLVGGFALEAGAGLVIAHPESTVGGRTWPQDGGLGGGYYATGPSLAAAASRRFALSPRLEVAVEGRFTASWARVPVAGGEATVNDRAVHLLLGLGWRFGGR